MRSYMESRIMLRDSKDPKAAHFTARKRSTTLFRTPQTLKTSRPTHLTPVSVTYAFLTRTMLHTSSNVLVSLSAPEGSAANCV